MAAAPLEEGTRRMLAHYKVAAVLRGGCGTLFGPQGDEAYLSKSERCLHLRAATYATRFFPPPRHAEPCLSLISFLSRLNLVRP